MEINEIKKLLYKQQPEAWFDRIKHKVAHYSCRVISDDETEDPINVRFQVPISDMGEASFEDKMPAKLLIRWII